MDIGLIFVIITLVIDLSIFASVYRLLRTNEVNPEWRKRVVGLLILGLGIAIYFTFIHKHERPEQLRLTGFPIPQTISRFENNEWRNYDPPHFTQLCATVVDFISGFAVALLPVKVASFVKQVKVATGRIP